MGCNANISVYGCYDRRHGHQDSGGLREYGKRDEGRQAEEQRLFQRAKDDPYITFHSDKIVQTGPNTFDLPGTFTIRGISKPETLTFTLVDKATARATGEGEVKGTMAFDRKEFGMNRGIPFIKIADRVEVTVNLKAKRISGPPLDLKE